MFSTSTVNILYFCVRHIFRGMIFFCLLSFVCKLHLQYILYFIGAKEYGRKKLSQLHFFLFLKRTSHKQMKIFIQHMKFFYVVVLQKVATNADNNESIY